ncbi:MAG: redoxin domain-containing protein [Gemmataceae bacterium]
MWRNLFTLIVLGVATACAANSTWAGEPTLIGKPASDFRLPDVVTGKDVRLSDAKDKIRVVIFYNHTCTFCRHYETRFRQFAADHAEKGVAVLAIDSTGRTAEPAAAAWKEKKMGFPLLLDDRARTAAALGATTMTTVCIIDARGKLRYVGAFDDSESGKDVRSRFVADAVAELMAGKPIKTEQTDVFACLIPLPE